MAQLIQAIAACAPKIALMKAIAPRRFIELITQRNTLSSGVVKNVQDSEVETLISLLKEGRPVHTGIAVFTPVIDTQGYFSISVRMDKRITAALNVPGEFTGIVNNAENIGKTSTELAIKWNSDFPDNLITLSEN
jgi:hypothetical protein